MEKLFNYFGYVKVSKISHNPLELPKRPDLLVANVTGTYTTKLSEDGESYLKNDYNISYLCFEREDGSRYYRYNGFNGDKYFSSPEKDHSIFVNWVAPWVNGANTIPEKFIVSKIKKSKCIHCSETFELNQEEGDGDYVKCKKCNMVNMNGYKFSKEDMQAFYEKIYRNLCGDLLNKIDELVSDKTLTKTQANGAKKFLTLVVNNEI